MDFQFVGQHVELTDALKQYAEKRVGKLEKFFPDKQDQEIQARVKLSVEGERQIADLQINGDGEFFEGTASSPDMYASIDGAVDKLGRQLRKFHEQRTHHRKKNNAAADRKLASTVLEFDREDEGGESRIVKRKTFTAKPMSTEEALLQMKSLGYQFLVFTNQVTNDINVVYERGDDSYGLIEAES